MEFPIEQLIVLFLVATALVVMYLEDLFAAAMVASVFSLLSACLYMVMDAVDVAFTEAAVGAGISTVLILGTLALTSDREHQQRFRIVPLIVVVLTGAVLIYGTLDMPHYGDPDAVIHHHTVPRYIEGSVTEFEIPNIVTNVLAGYRGYDTLGETTVILTATLGVLLLLGASRKKRKSKGSDAGDGKPAAGSGPGEPDDAAGPRTHAVIVPSTAVHQMMHNYVILSVVVKLLVPFILLFGLYVQFHGDFGPGGGFQSGVILGAGMIVYGLILGLVPMKRVAPKGLIEVGLIVGVLLYAGTGAASILMGGNFLDYSVLSHDPIHGRHLGILLVEGGVGITVCCAMILIFYAFAGRRAVRAQQTEEREP